MIHFGTQRVDRIYDEVNSCTRLRPSLEYLTLCGIPFFLGIDVPQVSGQQSIRAPEVNCASCLEKDSVRLPSLVIEICSKGYMDTEELLDIGVPKDVIEMIFGGIEELQDIILTVQQVTEGVFNILLPDGPKCRKCGHVPCPYCRNWCDSFTPDEEPCCDMECDFPADEYAAWTTSIEPILDDAEDRGCGVIQQNQRDQKAS